MTSRLSSWVAIGAAIWGLSWAGAALAQTAAVPAPAPASTPPAALPSQSVYQLHAALTDQDGKPFKLDDHRGRPVLISMFYSSCQYVCPMLIETMQLTDKALSAPERAGIDLVLVTFDPEHDDVKALKAVVDGRGLVNGRWTVARAEPAVVRKVAAALGIQYRRLPDGEFNHTTAILLLDSEGRPVARTKKMGAVDPAFVQQIRQHVPSGS